MLTELHVLGKTNVQLMVQNLAIIPITDQCLIYQSVFWTVGTKKEAGRQTSLHISKKNKRSPNFGLCTCAKVKHCSLDYKN